MRISLLSIFIILFLVCPSFAQPTETNYAVPTLYTGSFLFITLCQSTSDNCSAKFDDQLQLVIYYEFDKAAIYEDSPRDLTYYLMKNLDYPDGSYQYRLTLLLYINEEGKIIDVRVPDKNKNDYTLLEISAISTLKEMPNWQPALCDNKPVPSIYPLPMNLTPHNSQKPKY